MKARLLLLLTLFTICGTVRPAQDDKGGGALSSDSCVIIRRDTIITVRCDTIVQSRKDLIAARPKAPASGVVTKRKMRRIDRVDREISKVVFVPKGTWMGGASISYSQLNFDNMNYLLVKDVDANGYTFGVNPYVGYFIKNNMAVGLRLTYNRSLVDLGNFALNLGDDFKINLKDMYYKEHDFQVAAFARTYMPLGKSKVFGFFSEARLVYGRSQAKIRNGNYEQGTLDGTFSESNSLRIGFAPGFTAFVQNWMAVEVQMGIMGFNFKWTEQTTNQVEQGSQNNFSGRFSIDLFSINIGTTIYL